MCEEAWWCRPPAGPVGCVDSGVFNMVFEGATPAIESVFLVIVAAAICVAIAGAGPLIVVAAVAGCLASGAVTYGPPSRSRR